MSDRKEITILKDRFILVDDLDHRAQHGKFTRGIKCVGEVCKRDNYIVKDGEFVHVLEMCDLYPGADPRGPFTFCTAFLVNSGKFIGPFNGWNTIIPLDECINAEIPRIKAVEFVLLNGGRNKREDINAQKNV